MMASSSIRPSSAGQVGLRWSPDSAEQHLVLARLLQRVAKLEQRDTTLQSKVAALEDRNAQLEASVRTLVQLAGLSAPLHVHTPTSVATATATAVHPPVPCEVTIISATAVPFMDDQLFRHIASHLDVKMLGRLAQVARRFGLKRIGGLSLVEEVAQQRLSQLIQEHQEGAQAKYCHPQRQTENALEVLHRSEQMVEPHHFVQWGPEVKVACDSIAHKASCGFETAVCAQVLHSGRHFAEVRILPSDDGQLSPTLPMMGVVGLDFDPRDGRPAWRCKQGYLYYAGDGQLNHDGEGTNWDGMAPVTLWNGLNSGQATQSVGLLLDLYVGSLEVFLRAETVGNRLGCWQRLGAMVVSGLQAPLRWAVDLADGAKVQVLNPSQSECNRLLQHLDQKIPLWSSSVIEEAKRARANGRSMVRTHEEALPTQWLSQRG